MSKEDDLKAIKKLESQKIKNPSSLKAKEMNAMIDRKIKNLGISKGPIKDQRGYSLYTLKSVECKEWSNSKNLYLNLKCVIPCHDGNNQTRYVRLNIAVDPALSGKYKGAETPLVKFLKVVNKYDAEFISELSESIADYEITMAKYFSYKDDSTDKFLTEDEDFFEARDAFKAASDHFTKLVKELIIHIAKSHVDDDGVESEVSFYHISEIDHDDKRCFRYDDFLPHSYEDLQEFKSPIGITSE